jgi:hypothetical protein
MDRIAPFRHDGRMDAIRKPSGEVVLDLAQLIGSFRRFGPTGPAYEILGIASHESPEGVLLRVGVVTTGERLDYPLVHALDDSRDA